MALIVVRDAKSDRERIINTDFIFHCCAEESGGVRIIYSQGASGRDSIVVPGDLDAFAKSVKATRVA
jgi:hypothetical protein